MQAATMQHPHQSQQSGVYLGNGIPRVSQHASTTATASSSAPGGVKKWKNKLKTFLNSPLPGQTSSQPASSSSSSSTATSSAISSAASTSSSATAAASATPRPDSPREKSRSSSPGPQQPFSVVADHHASSTVPTPAAATTSTNAPSAGNANNNNTSTSANYQSDVYAGYDISVNWPSNAHEDTDAGPNDSYEARLSRLVGDLENVDYGSFAASLGGAGTSNSSGDILVTNSRSHSRSGGADSAGNLSSDVDTSGNIRISSSLFNNTNRNMHDGDNHDPVFASTHPFAYASAGTPSHLDSSNGPSSLSTSKPFSNNFLSNSLNFQNQFPLSSSPSSNGIINIEDALNSFSSPYFTDFSTYTNFDDDVNTADIRIPSFDAQQSSGSEAHTPSSSASVPLSAVHSASSNASGKSTAATSEILPPHFNSQQQRNLESLSGNTSIPVPFSMPDIASLCAPETIRHSSSMPFAPFQEMSISMPDSSATHGNPSNEDETSDAEDDDFSSLLRQSQIEAGSGSSHTTVGATAGSTTLSSFQGQSLPSTSSLSTQAASPLNIANFDLTMFPMPKSTGTASVKMGSQPSTGSESSYGPSPSLSYGGSSTSNTSFDDPNANKDNVPFTPKKSKGGTKNGKNDPKNLSISLEEPEYNMSDITISPGVKTPTHSPHPSISSVPATPSSYKTASSVPTSPYRPRPVVHASALAWRVAPSPHSPQSAITVDTTRSIRPVASQSFIGTDPFAITASPSRLSKLSTASSPELKRRRNTADDEDLGSPSGIGGIEARLSNVNDDSFAQIGSQMLLPMSESASPLRPIAYRRRVAHKFSTPQLAVQMPQRQDQQLQQTQQLQPAPVLHQRQYSQPLPVTNQMPLQYNMPSSAGPSTTHFQNSQQLQTRQYTSPLPSPSSAAMHYTQQQQQHQQPQTVSPNPWLSDNIITSLITQLSDQSYMCLMQNCGLRYGTMDEIKSHITGHFAPQAVPLQQSQPVYQQQSQNIPQYQIYQQPTQYPQSQQQTWI